MKTILIIAHDTDQVKILQQYLLLGSIESEVESCGESGLKKAMENKYDLIMMDTMTPDFDCFEVCKQVRELYDIPILIVSDKDNDLLAVQSLHAGADEYIIDESYSNKLAYKIHSHLLRYDRLTKHSTGAEESKQNLNFGRLDIRPAERRVFVDGKEIELKNKEFELLYFMATHPNIVYDRETLYQKVWGIDSMGDNTTVYVHIYHIRKKIEKDPAKPYYIQTIRSSGYRFQQ